MHREAKAMLKDRDKREKSRIEGKGVHSTNPIEVPAVSAGFADSATRFRTDISSMLSKDRETEKEKHEKKVATLKDMRLAREVRRWDSMEVEDVKAANDAKMLAGTGLRNRGSVGYNLINGSWGNSLDAAKAKYHDDCVEYTAKLRSQNLDRRGNSGPFNILTGEERCRVQLPPVPTYKPPTA